MLSLKRFGDWVLNSLKNLNKTYKKQKQQLRLVLFIQPIITIVVSLVLIFVTFNSFIYYFLDTQIDDSIRQEFQFLDQKLSEHSQNATRQKELFNASYMIVDADNKVYYLSASSDDLISQNESEEVLSYLNKNNQIQKLIKANHNSTNQSDAANILIESTNYFVDAKKYRGTFEDYYIKSSNQPKNYYVIAFVNSTPLMHFVILINCVLLLLAFAILSLAWRHLYNAAKKLDTSFNNLKNYVFAVGERKSDIQFKSTDFDEFNDIISAVNTMNTMINDGEKKQQAFFQNASHELRTPLMSIQGYAENISEGLSDNPKRDAKIIFKESFKMKSLVDDILFTARMERNEQKIQFDSISLLDLLYDLTWRLQPEATKKNLQFEHHFDRNYIEIEADEETLERAFLNILSNALRYAKNKITISVQTTKNDVNISIANDGEAIPEKDLPHIFERFYKGKKGNTGLGLALTKEIISEHHGKIEVVSKENVTCFKISLPIKQSKR